MWTIGRWKDSDNADFDNDTFMAVICRCVPVHPSDYDLSQLLFILRLFPVWYVGCMLNLFVIRSNIFSKFTSRARSGSPIGRIGYSSASHNALRNRIPNAERSHSRKAAYSGIWKNPWGLPIPTSFMHFHLKFYSKHLN